MSRLGAVCVDNDGAILLRIIDEAFVAEYDASTLDDMQPVGGAFDGERGSRGFALCLGEEARQFPVVRWSAVVPFERLCRE